MVDNHSTINNNHIDGYIEQLLNGSRLTETQLLHLCEKAKEILAQEENIVYVNTPVTICGAVNNQFRDLLELFQNAGNIPDTNYLFLGNYASRSYHTGVEIIYLLLAYKVRYNKKITLLRGGLDNLNQTHVFGPLVAIVEDTFFCVNSGLSSRINSIDQIKSLNRAKEPSRKDPISDFMCTQPGLDDMIEDWERGGIYFSQKVTEKFLYTNNLKMLCRGRFTTAGYSFHHGGLIVTVFSTPNYVGHLGNSAAVLDINETFDIHFKIFDKSNWEFQQIQDFIKKEEERQKKEMQNFGH